MRKYLIILLLLSSTCSESQSIVKELLKDKAFWAGNACAFMGGASDGVNQTIQFHYSDFKQVFPSANDQWCNPQISWQNKYEEPFLGKRTFFVATTDLYHATRMSDNFFSITMMPVFSTTNSNIFDPNLTGKQRWRHFKKSMLEGMAHYTFRQIGFNLMYDGLFNKS